MTFNRYYVSYPLCCPSRVSLLTGRYAHNHNVRGNVQPNGGYTGFAFRGAYTHNLATWLQGAGYRTIHIGKFLNGYGDEPYRQRHRQCRPAGAPGTRSSTPTPTTTTTATRSTTTASIDGPFGDSGSWDTARIRRPRRLRLPLRAAQRPALLYETDVFNRHRRPKRCTGRRPNSPSTCSSTTPPRTATSAARPGPEPAPRHYDSLQRRAPSRTTARKASTRATSTTSRASSAKRPTSSLERHPHLPRLLPEGAGVAARDRRRGETGASTRSAALHRLRNTYIIFTSDNGFFYGEHRLTGGKFLAYEPSTHLPFLIRGPGIKRRHLDRRAGGQHRHRPDDPRTGRGRRRTKASTARSLVPFFHDPEPAHAGGRSSSSPSSRPTTSKRTAQRDRAERVGDQSSATPPARRSGAAAGASASIVAPPKDYEGIRLGPYKYIEWPDGEKELYDINKDPYELNNIVRDPQLLPDPRLPPRAS